MGFGSCVFKYGGRLIQNVVFFYLYSLQSFVSLLQDSQCLLQDSRNLEGRAWLISEGLWPNPESRGNQVGTPWHSAWPPRWWSHYCSNAPVGTESTPQSPHPTHKRMRRSIQGVEVKDINRHGGGRQQNAHWQLAKKKYLTLENAGTLRRPQIGREKKTIYQKHYTIPPAGIYRCTQ